ncbi:MAG: hypothetical protein OEY80_10110, partial [Nitrospirota bacterium]|nr:hypothetical protein [Nitrospirota bacterium]
MVEKKSESQQFRTVKREQPNEELSWTWAIMKDEKRGAGFNKTGPSYQTTIGLSLRSKALLQDKMATPVFLPALLILVRAK